jgi:hypothetical protein
VIIQIALGIVLAVLILVFLPQIIAFGAIGLVVVAGLAAVGLAVYFAITEPAVSAIILVVSAIVGGAIYLDNLKRRGASLRTDLKALWLWIRTVLVRNEMFKTLILLAGLVLLAKLFSVFVSLF